MAFRQPVSTSGSILPSDLRVDFGNRIYFSPDPGKDGAGLIDRLTIFGILLNLAGYLCARVYMPLDPNSCWAHSTMQIEHSIPICLGDFMLWNDPQQQAALLDWDNPNDLSMRPDEVALFNRSSDETIKFGKFPKHIQVDFIDLAKYSLVQQHNLNIDNQHDGEGIDCVIKVDYFYWCNLIASYLRKLRSPENNSLEHRVPQTPSHPRDSFPVANMENLTSTLLGLREKIVHQILDHSTADTHALSSRPLWLGISTFGGTMHRTSAIAPWNI